jgi:hypothetical protein
MLSTKVDGRVQMTPFDQDLDDIPF